MNHIAPTQYSPSSVRRSALALLLGVGIGLTACNKEEPAKAPAAASPEAKPAPAVEAPKPAAAEQPKAETPKPAEEKPAPAPAPTPAPSASSSGPTAKEVSDRVAAFRAFHPFSNGGELSQVPQFASQLANLLDGIAKDPVQLGRVQKALGSEPGGKATLNLKLKDYSGLFAVRLLSEVLSGQPERLVDFVLNNPNGASFILSQSK